MLKRSLVPCTLAIGLLLNTPTSLRAEGAVAVAQPEDIVRDGYAFGLSGNFATEKEARSAAIERCRSEPNAAESTKDMCTVVYTYSNGCVSGALDPEEGTPGAGWGAGDTRAEAEEAALSACRHTAGPERTQFCKIIATQCDGRAE